MSAQIYTEEEDFARVGRLVLEIADEQHLQNITSVPAPTKRCSALM